MDALGYDTFISVALSAIRTVTACAARVPSLHQIPLFEAPPIFRVSEFATAPGRTLPPPCLLAELEINLDFTIFFFFYFFKRPHYNTLVYFTTSLCQLTACCVS